MLKKILSDISLIIFVCLILVSCHNVGNKGENFAQEEEATEVSDIDTELWARADSTLAGLTLEQMVGQCFIPSVMSESDSLAIRQLREYIVDLHVGGILLLRGDLHSAAMLAKEARLARVPLFRAIDAEWGLGMRLAGAPAFPKNGEIGEEAGEMFIYDYGREVARESHLVGINMVLGPVVDVVERKGGVIGDRSFGSNPERVSEMGIAYALGLESGGVLSVAKHFPGHGSSSVDSHKKLPVVDRNMERLDSIDLLPFRNYINSGLSGVMVGHLAVPAIDSTMMPAAMSKEIISGMLRNELGFRGLVLTDALNMGGADGFSAVDALKAGADIVVSPANPREEIEGVVFAVKNGSLPEKELREKVRRILYYKNLFEMDEVEEDFEKLGEKVFLQADSIKKKLLKYP